MDAALLARCTGADLAHAERIAPFIDPTFDEFDITTARRQAAFLAQAGHETMNLIYMAEIWGPSDQQKRYEPPGTLAAALGNTQPGDGHRFKGRGLFEITGRGNYLRFGTLLKLDLVGHPELAEEPEVACRTAGLYWEDKHLNQFADSGDFAMLTRRINGGLTGYANRLMLWGLAKAALGAI